MLPRSENMVVEDDAIDSMPLLTWDEKVEVDVDVFETWCCRARVHRNQIFVVDRNTWTTRLLAPILSSELAIRAIETARPAAASAAVISIPIIGATSRFSWSSIRNIGAGLVRTAVATAQNLAGSNDDIIVPDKPLTASMVMSHTKSTSI